MKLIKSVSGIRGIFNKTLTLEDISKYAYAFSEIQKKSNLPILIARDSRTTGRQISSHIIKVLTKAGRDIIDCDIIPTPTAQIVTDKFNIAGAIVVTASHNPKNWNALKLFNSQGEFILQNDAEEIFNLVKKDIFSFNSEDNYGQVFHEKDAFKIHINM